MYLEKKNKGQHRPMKQKIFCVSRVIYRLETSRKSTLNLKIDHLLTHRWYQLIERKALIS